VTGRQCIGVSTLSAGASRSRRVGFASLAHIPSGGTFARGVQRSIVSNDRPATTTREIRRGTSDDGDIPKLRWTNAPSTAFCGMSVTPQGFEPLTDEVRVDPVVVTEKIAIGHPGQCLGPDAEHQRNRAFGIIDSQLPP
jgi:hypothetical protein